MEVCGHVKTDEGLSEKLAPFGILPKRGATEILRVFVCATFLSSFFDQILFLGVCVIGPSFF